MNEKFNVCSASALRKWKTTLNDSYSKEKVIGIVKSLPFWGENDNVTIGYDKASKLYDDILRKRSGATKDDWVDLLARLLATEENRRELWRCMPIKFHRVATYLYRHVFITPDELSRIAGEDSSTYMSWLMNLNSWSFSANYYMPASVLTAFPDLTPRPATDFMTTVLPPEWDYRVASFEGEMTRVLPVLQNMYDTGIIERGKVKATATVINKATKMVAPGEFYPEVADKGVATWRTQLLVNAYSSMRNSSPIGMVLSPLEAVESMYRLLVSSPSAVYEFVLKLLFSKLTSAVAWGMSYPELVRMLQRLLVSYAAGDRWLLREGLENELLRDPEGRRDLLFFRSEPLMNAQLKNVWSEIHVTPTTQVEEAGVPMVDTILSLLCAMGILELAYEDDDPRGEASPMPYILAMRLTPLGRYVMGIDKSYQVPKVDDVVYFEADPDHLVLRSLVEPNPYEPILKDFARPIGSKRFVVDNASFLSGCNSFTDVKRRVDIFRQVLAATELPPNWESFLHRMLMADQGIDSVSGFVVYELDPECSDLIDALVTDSELRRIVVRAEGYRILVDRKNLPDLRRCLARYGYLVPK